jgi:tight adherence protein B
VIVALGLVLGIGVVLVVSPGLWPPDPAGAHTGPNARMRCWLAEAGFDRVPPAAFVVVLLSAAAAAGGVAIAVIPVVGAGVVVGLVVALAPVSVVSSRARTRRRQLRASWPDLVDHLVSSVRAGQSLGDAIAGLAEIGPVELRPAFREFSATVRSTGTLAPALDDLKARLADPVADRIVETLRMAREVGGTELPSVLRALSASLRQDAAVRAEVEARQSWVVNAARLGVAAPWIVLLLLAGRPEAAAAYNSPAGLTLLGVGFGVTVVAYRVMLAVGRLPEERRWFA